MVTWNKNQKAGSIWYLAGIIGTLGNIAGIIYVFMSDNPKKVYSLLYLIGFIGPLIVYLITKENDPQFADLSLKLMIGNIAITILFLISLPIILASLFALGAFSTQSIGAHCITLTPFSCSSTPSPVLATNGLLTLTLGQSTGSPIYIGGAACSTASGSNGMPVYGNQNVGGTGIGASMPPGTTYSPNENPIESGAEFNLVLTCYNSYETPGNPANQYPLGSTFTGFIWLNYSTTSASGPWTTTLITTSFSVKASKLSTQGAN